MPIPKKNNPRRYTVTTKVTKNTYLALNQLAREEADGNLSKWLSVHLEHDSYVVYYPELDDPKFFKNQK